MEMLARRLSVFQVVLVFSGGGARCSFTAGHLLPRARGPRWPPCAFIPALEFVAATPGVDLVSADSEARRRCGRRNRMEALRSSRIDGFLSVRGHLLIQGLIADAAAARCRHALFFVGDSVLQEDLVVILFFVEVFRCSSSQQTMQPMEGILVALASYGADMLAEMAKDKVAMLTRVSGEIDDLGVKLMDLKNFLADADRRDITDEGMRRWVEDLKHAMYDDVTHILGQFQLKVTE